MTGAPTGALARLEGDGRVLGLVKLANVALAMLWGFAVTFVFVRLLPIAEFRAFLLLIAFANFTVSADFGFSGIVYARLRAARTGGGAFRPRDIAALFAFMLAVVLAGGAAVAASIASGAIGTGRPGLFALFYLLTSLNILLLLARRALAALDRNLWWEGLDMARRLASLALLGAALAGLPILLSVALQTGLSVALLAAGLSLVHRETGMTAADWSARPRGKGLWAARGADMRATMMLTLSDVAAYNAPYFGIAAVTHDPRPLLVFDFLFKMSRGLTAVVRAVTEAALPRLTADYHGRRDAAFQHGLRRLMGLAIGLAAALSAVLLVAGPAISAVLFDGKAVLTRVELAIMVPLFVGLSVICVSTFVQNAVGLFARLLPASFAFLAGTVAAIAIGAIAGPVAGTGFTIAFLGALALVHAALGLVHRRLIAGLAAR